MTNYVFVLDANGKQLAPTKEQKAWYLIRKKRATLVSKYPMVIQLNKEIPNDEICTKYFTKKTSNIASYKPIK